jgi:hypothetical protein
LSGEKFNEVFLFDIATGTAQRFRTEGWAGKTAGNGSYFGKRFVATYVDTDRERVMLQVATIRYPLDGSTRAISSVESGGLFSTLTGSTRRPPDDHAARAYSGAFPLAPLRSGLRRPGREHG